MTGTNLVKTLTTKYAKLLGEYEFAERMTEDAVGMAAIMEATNRCDTRKKEITEKLEAIETVIWMYDADWDPAKVRPNYPRKKHLKPGAIIRAGYAVLRDAKIPMTSRQIARVVAERLGYGKLEERGMMRIDNAIYNTLSSRVGKTVMIASREPTRWSIIPRDQVVARSKLHEIGPASAPAETEPPALPATRQYAS
jgi:hypothetical protein